MRLVAVASMRRNHGNVCAPQPTPSQSSEYAEGHDANMMRCLSQLLDLTELPGDAKVIAQLPFREGGLGLRSAARMAPGAYWASWADCL